MTIEVITNLNQLDPTDPDKATKLYLYPDVTNKQYTYYQWDDNAGDSGDFVKLSDSVNGSVVSSPQYIRAIIDNDLNFLAGIETDGNFKFNQLPRQIVDYIGQFFTVIDSDVYAYAIIDNDLNVLFKINK